MNSLPLSWSTLEQLGASYGEELYLLDLGTLRRNYLAWRDALRAAWPDSAIAYSYKTNYTPAICATLHELGALAEVVSSLELDLADRLGVPGSHVVFNGPYKRPAEMERALLGGALVFLDGLHEVEFVETIVRAAIPPRVHVGLRCQIELPGSPASRFGFDADGGEFAEAVDRLVRLPGCEAVNLHAHYMSARRLPEDFAAIAARLIDACRRIPARHRPAIVDVGGGFYSQMPPELAAQFGGGVPTPAEYADAIGGVLRAAFPNTPRPRLLVEPGMALVADAMSLATRVVAMKTLGERRLAQVASTRYSLQPTLSTRALPVTVHRAPGAPPAPIPGPVDVVGYTCMEHDCLRAGLEDTVDAGDWLVFDHAGAYTNVLRPPFIAPCPAIVAFDGPTGPIEVAKRAETSDDVFASYVVKRVHAGGMAATVR